MNYKFLHRKNKDGIFLYLRRYPDIADVETLIRGAYMRYGADLYGGDFKITRSEWDTMPDTFFHIGNDEEMMVWKLRS